MGYKQNTELTTGCGTAEGNINEVATKGGTGYRGTAMFPSGRKKKRDKREKRKEPCFSEKRTELFTNGCFYKRIWTQPKERDDVKGNAACRNGRLSRSCLACIIKIRHDYPMSENLLLGRLWQPIGDACHSRRRNNHPIDSFSKTFSPTCSANDFFLSVSFLYNRCFKSLHLKFCFCSINRISPSIFS